MPACSSTTVVLVQCNLVLYTQSLQSLKLLFNGDKRINIFFLCFLSPQLLIVVVLAGVQWNLSKVNFGIVKFFTNFQLRRNGCIV